MKKSGKKPSPREARPFDHAVLPVASLETARAWLTRLGFTVAPDARHPFGTENCCVYFADGTYLEPLAIGQRETCEAEAIKGNVFVARDQAYRFRHGETGVSAVVFGTDSAKSDHKSFSKAGISAGKRLEFSRNFTGPGGKKGKAAFELAFAADLRAPDLFFFTCERVKSPKADMAKLHKHKNGVKAVTEVVLSEINPSDFQYFLQEIINEREQNAHSFGLDIAAANANISVLTPVGLKTWFGIEDGSTERGLKARVIILRVSNLDNLRALLKENEIVWHEIANRLVVRPELENGAVFAFEAAK